MPGIVIVVIERIVSFGKESGGLSQLGVETHPDNAGIRGGQVSRDCGWDGRDIPFLRCGHTESSRLIRSNKCCWKK